MPPVISRVVSRPWLTGLAVLVVGHLALILSRRYVPGGDWAFIDLRTSDVFSSHTPLTGAWSRYGWNHPGPALYELLALPRALTGGSWRGVWIGAMALNVAAVAAAGSMTARHGRIVSGAWVVACCWTVAAATPHLFTDPWNASVVVLGSVAVAAGATAALLDDRRGIAVALVVFTLVSQTHAAYGVLLLPVVVTVLVVGLRRHRRWTLGWLGAAAFTCLPVLIDTLVDRPGNLWRAVRFTLTSDEPAVGAGEAIRVVGRTTSLTFFADPRLPSFVANVSDTPWGVLPFAGLAALAAAWWCARGRGWIASQRSAEVIALLWLGGALMTARTRGPLLIWLTTWSVAVAALTWCVVVAVAVRWLAVRRLAEGRLAERSEHWRTVVGGLAIAAVSGALATANVVGSVGVGYPFQELTPVVEQFADAATTSGTVDDDDEPIMVDLAGDEYVAGAVQSALIDLLEQRGARPLARPDQALQLGEHRAASSLAPPRLLVQVEPRSAAPPASSELSVWDPLGTAERAEADALMDDLGALLDAAGLSDRRELIGSDLAALAALDAPASVAAEAARFERLGELHARGPRIVLYLVTG